MLPIVRVLKVLAELENLRRQVRLGESELLECFSEILLRGFAQVVLNAVLVGDAELTKLVEDDGFHPQILVVNFRAVKVFQTRYNLLRHP